jgi:hypothetical protein
VFDTWANASFLLPVGVTAASISFGDAAGVAGFDDVVVLTVPEPGTYALLGLLGLGAFLRRNRPQSQS